MPIPEGIMAEGTHSGYERKSVHALEEVIPYIGQTIGLDGDQVALVSVRMLVFAKSVTCTACGIIGTHFAKERSHRKTKSDHPLYGKWHLNLYGMDLETGKEVMLTKDHIIPRSKGGPSTMDNLQTMCAPCNCRKGSSLNSLAPKDKTPSTGKLRAVNGIKLGEKLIEKLDAFIAERVKLKYADIGTLRKDAIKEILENFFNAYENIRMAGQNISVRPKSSLSVLRKAGDGTVNERSLCLPVVRYGDKPGDRIETDTRGTNETQRELPA